jgi:predicted amidohydrolase YtcJ
MRKPGSGFCALGFACLLAAAGACAAPQLVLVNGKIFTADDAHPTAQAVAVENGLILAVGTDERILALANSATRIIDVGQRLVTPGLVEAHVHIGLGLPSRPLSLPNMPFPGPTGEQVLAAVAEAAKNPEPSASGWISAYVGPTIARDTRNWRQALDAVAPDTPVLLRGFWGHTSITNSAGLKRMGIAEDVADPLGGWWARDANGRLDGHAWEAAETMETLVRPEEPAQLRPLFEEAGQQYAHWGVTAIHLMNTTKSVSTTLAVLGTIKRRQKWTVYSWGVWQTPSNDIEAAWRVVDEARGKTPPNVRVEGPKWVLDGTPLDQLAHRRSPYPDRPDWSGRSNFTDAQLREILRLALSRPSQLALHVVGDAETARLFKAMEDAAPAARWRSIRVRIEHGDGIRPDLMAQAARLGLVVTQNPTHLDSSPGGLKVMHEESPLNSLSRAGIAVALGSDGGPRERNPFLNFMLSITDGTQPSEALSREQALKAYTSGGAYAGRQEGQQGRIAAGMAADLAVLSQDILTVPVQQLPATKSLLTLVDGEVVFEDPMLAPGK